MNFLTRLFGKRSAPSQSKPAPEPAPAKTSAQSPSLAQEKRSPVKTLPLEDVRANRSQTGEVIFNLWYVTDEKFIRALRAKSYVASGSDDEMLRFLRDRSRCDFHDAFEFQVPDQFLVDASFWLQGEEVGPVKMCVHSHIEDAGMGYQSLFREFLQNVPDMGHPYDPSNALVCVTALVLDADGNLSVSISRETTL
jgi:hypothetical protein